MSLIARAGVALRICVPSVRESAVQLEWRIYEKTLISTTMCGELMTTVDIDQDGQNWYADGGKGKQLEAGRWRRIGNSRLMRRMSGLCSSRCVPGNTCSQRHFLAVQFTCILSAHIFPGFA
jgi:hypothetical protein